MVVRNGIAKIADLKGKTVAASRARHRALLHAGLDPEEERPVGEGRDGRQPRAAARPRRRSSPAQNDAAMTYEPYLSTVRAKPEAGKIIATTLDYPMVMDTFGCTPKFLAENPKAAKALADSYFEAVDMIKKEPKKSYEIMGADVKQSGEQFEASAEVPALAGQGREPEVLRRRASQQFSKEAADLLLEIGIIKADADIEQARRHAVHQVATSAGAPRRRRLGDASAAPSSARDEAARARRAGRASRSASRSSSLFVAGVGVGDVRRLRVEDLPRRPADDAARGLGAARAVRLRQRHRHDDLARVRRLRRSPRLLGVPLGIAMGAYKPIEAFFEPFVSFARYLPASAFIPLLILWAGIGETQKLLVIFIGSFFQIVLMVAVTVGARGATSSRPPTRSAPTPTASCAACCCPSAAPADRGDAAARARLGVDLRDRRRADRRVERHRPHDHRQPGAAQHRPDHLRHHRHRRHRPRLRPRVQAGATARCFRGAC